MTIRTSTVLYSDKETNEMMRRVCEAIVEEGGSFSISHKYTHNWFVEYVLDFKGNVETPEAIRSGNETQ